MKKLCPVPESLEDGKVDSHSEMDSKEPWQVLSLRELDSQFPKHKNHFPELGVNVQEVLDLTLYKFTFRVKSIHSKKLLLGKICHHKIKDSKGHLDAYMREDWRLCVFLFVERLIGITHCKSITIRVA